MKEKLIRLLVGTPDNRNNTESIRTLWSAAKWRIAGLPWLDAIVNGDGTVMVRVRRTRDGSGSPTFENRMVRRLTIQYSYEPEEVIHPDNPKWHGAFRLVCPSHETGTDWHRTYVRYWVDQYLDGRFVRSICVYFAD